ncbi:hypothetical protein HPB47_008823 [Ixodes persulcatus]|uniref:Uncharacterized protein n=1 Tax=Ixodes persulcatus TaxID=34615 RepID=A0AC60P457_IXOPE|nr:hypothetical protein HPB47_008823 [Ixodes persulcatus]
MMVPMWLVPVLGLLLLLAPNVNCHGTGAPSSQCDSMLPNHAGSTPQESAAPYNVSRELQPDHTVKVTLTGTNPFKGFFIQARRADDQEALVPGKFTVSDESVIQTLNCEEKQSSAVTHLDKSEKSEIVVFWTPPSDWDGEVVFRATVVQGYMTYWDRVFSSRLHVSGGGEGPPSQEPETPEPPGNRYSGCGRSFGCYGIPQGCQKKGSCSLLLTHKADRDGVLYELSAPSTGTDIWIAAGLSDSKAMEHAHVVECHLKGGQTSIRESWNGDGYENSPVERTSGVDYRKREHADGMLTCSWHRSHLTKIGPQTFNTLKNKYHLLLASGPLVAGTDVTAIFFATSLDRAQLKDADWFVYILAAFVGFHVMVHVVMQVHSMVMERKTKTSVDIKMQEMSRNGNHVAHGDDIQPPSKDAPGGGFRRFMLGIYMVVALFVVAALVATIWFATS